MKKQFYFFFILLIFFATNISAQNYTVTNISAQEGSAIHKYSKFEVGFQINSSNGVPVESVVNNVYDEDDIKVECFFYKSGELVAIRPAFYYKDFCRGSNAGCSGASNNPANLIPLDTPQPWRVRYAPSIAGSHYYQIKVTINNQSYFSPVNNFFCINSNNPGFVKTASNNTNFKFDNGEIFFPIGENLAWYDGLSPAKCSYNLGINRREYTACVIDYFEEWTDELSENGGSFSRIMMTPWSWELDKWNNEGIPGVDLGNFDHNQFKAYDLDKIFEMYAEKEIYVIMAIMVPQALASMNHAGYSWLDNPYNLDSSLNLSNFKQFFTNIEARRIYKNKLRYIIARWGWSPNLFAYEPFNEVDHIESGNIPPYDEYESWYIEMINFIKSIDDRHMVTSSCASYWNCLEVFNNDNIDFSRAHNYSSDKYIEYQRNYISSFMMNEKVMRKPFLYGEYGFRTECYSAEERQLEVHNTLWANSFSGAGSAPLVWYWEKIHHPSYGGHYNYFSTLTNFFEDADIFSNNLIPIGNAQNSSLTTLQNNGLAPQFDEKGFASSGILSAPQIQHLPIGISTSNDEDIEVFALKSDELVVGWIHNLQSYWFNSDYNPVGCPELTDANFNQTIPSLNNVTLTIDDLRCNGEYKVEWFNTHYDYNDDKVVDHQQTIINDDLPSIYTNNVHSVNGMITINVPNLVEITANSYPYAPDYGFKIKLVNESLNKGWKHVVPNENNNTSNFKINGFIEVSDEVSNVLYRGEDGKMQIYWNGGGDKYYHNYVSTSQNVDGNSKIITTDTEAFFYDNNKRIKYFKWDGMSWKVKTPNVQNYNVSKHSVDGDFTLDKSTGSIYYRGSDGKLQQLYKCSDSYCHKYVNSSNSSNVKAHQDSKIIASENKIYYFNSNKFFRYFILNGNSWVFKTPIGGGSTSNRFEGKGMALDDTGNIYYRGENDNIQQFYKCGNNLCHAYLLYSNSNDKKIHFFSEIYIKDTKVVYFNKNSHFRYFQWSSGSGWQFNSIGSNNEYKSNGKLFTKDNNVDSYYYRGYDGNLHQFWYDGSSYKHALLGSGLDDNVMSTSKNLVAKNGKVFYSHSSDRFLNYYEWNPCSEFSPLNENSDSRSLIKQNVDSDMDYSFVIFPNPLQENSVNLKLNLDKELVLTIDIIDINGEVKHQLESNKLYPEGENQISKEVQYLLPGIYFIRVFNEKGIQIKKLIKL